MIAIWSGVWVHEGHYVSFTVLEDDYVVIKELLEKPNGQDDAKSEKVYDIDEAIAYQKKLISFGYNEIGVRIL